MTAPREQEDAFLVAIRDEPDDLTPRLVFADWLEERGDPRGEFIRLQCLLSQMDEDDPAAEAFQHRTDELFDRHEDEWVSDPPDVAEEMAIDFSKDGNFSQMFVSGGKLTTVQGTYQRDGDKVTITSKFGDKEFKQILTVKKLTDTELVTVDEMGNKNSLKRVPDEPKR